MFPSRLQCIENDCRSSFDIDSRLYTCSRCGGLLDVAYDFSQANLRTLQAIWDGRWAGRTEIDRSGVWRYRELLPPADVSEVVTLIEGNTQLLDAPRSAKYAGLDHLTVKHLGLNPTGSFKDLGMTTGITQARRLGARSVACASTGNTSASMAAYAARAGLKAFVFVPAGQIALGKLAQALDYGAKVLQVEGDFDTAMSIVRAVTSDTDLYLLNSINAFRLEGQKTIGFELLQQREWRIPDRIVSPGGNLGNSSAVAKGLQELVACGVIERIPRMTIVQAAGANPLYRMWQRKDSILDPLANPATLATAIKIGSPVSWKKAKRGLEWSGGNVEEVSEQEIADAKAILGSDGIGCEPASAVTLAGIRKMVAEGRMQANEDVVAILTGHVLKDPEYTVRYHEGSLSMAREDGKVEQIESHFSNRLMKVSADPAAIRKVLSAEC